MRVYLGSLMFQQAIIGSVLLLFVSSMNNNYEVWPEDLLFSPCSLCVMQYEGHP